MEKLISKKLLSEVFNKEVLNIISSPNEDITIGQNEVIIVFNGYRQKWNIYELAHKGKEWAFNRGWEISSGVIKKSGYMCFIQEAPSSKLYDFYGNNEVEAIFKACEWIRKWLLK